jgi:ADP-ribose pyrophosphatase YjhB (NUDIX family)
VAEPVRPRVRVAAIIRLDGGIVLVRHRKDGLEYHLLPGGGVGTGETLEAALVREVREETGLEIAVGSPRVLADTIAPDGSRHVVNVVFDADIRGGALTDTPADPRVAAAEVCAVDSLHALDLRPPMADAIADAVRGTGGCAYLGALWSPAQPSAG